MELIPLLVLLAIPLGFFIAVQKRWKDPPPRNRPDPAPRTEPAAAPDELLQISRSVALSIPNGSPGPGTGFTFTHRGLAGRLQFTAGKTDILISTRDLIRGTVEIHPVGFPMSLFRDGDEEQIRIGGSREEYLRIFETRAEEHILREIGVAYDLRMGPEGLSFRVRALPGSSAALGYWLACAFRLVDLIPGIDVATRMEVASMSNVAGDDTTCQVCGTSLSRGAIVRCAQCSTLHHEDCWQYVRACSTFGCRSPRFTR